MNDDPATLVARRYARGATVAAVVVAVGWHLGHGLPATLLNWSGYRHPWLAAAAWIGYLLIGVVAAVALLRSRPIRAVWAYAAAALAVVATMIAVSPADQVIGPGNWAWASVGWLGVILFWRRRHHLRELCLFLAADALIVLTGMIAAGATDRVTLARYLMVLVGSLTLQIGGSVGGHALDTAARWAADASARRAATEAAHRGSELVHADRLRRYEAVRQAAADLLAEIADGADPADERLRRECAVGAARLRRLMAETDDDPGPLLRTLRTHVLDAESRRVMVTMEPPVGTIPHLPPGIAEALAAAPAQALREARTEARVTVYATPREVIVSVVADVDPEPSDRTDAYCGALDGGAVAADDGDRTGGHADADRADGGGVGGSGAGDGGAGGGRAGADRVNGDGVGGAAAGGGGVRAGGGCANGNGVGGAEAGGGGVAGGGVGGRVGGSRTDGGAVGGVEALRTRDGVEVTRQVEGNSLWIQSSWPVG